jgi:NADH-quinone oxidoreductase subunit G
VSPHSTVEELYLAAALVRGLGSDNIDYRLRNADFSAARRCALAGYLPIASLSQLQRVLVVGSNLRKDHPLFAQRIRQAARMGGVVSALQADGPGLGAAGGQHGAGSRCRDWVQALANIAAAIAAEKGVAAPSRRHCRRSQQAIAKSLLGGERKAVLLGNAAAHHAKASSLLALANWIGAQTGATVGYLTEAANTVGAQSSVRCRPLGGQNAGQMLAGGLQAVVLLNTEPVFDSAAGATAVKALGSAQRWS